MSSRRASGRHRYPGWLADKVVADTMTVVDAACRQIVQLRDSGAFVGVHLVPVHGYWEMTARLEALTERSAVDLTTLT